MRENSEWNDQQTENMYISTLTATASPIHAVKLDPQETVTSLIHTHQERKFAHSVAAAVVKKPKATTLRDSNNWKNQHKNTNPSIRFFIE